MPGTVKSLSPSRELGDFCDFLYGKEQGYAYLPTKNEEGAPQPWTPYFFQWPLQKDQLVKHALKMSGVRDVYIAPSLFTKPDAKVENALGANVLWADFDSDVPSNATLAEHNVPKPALRIQSSPGRQHLYWRLEQFNTDIKMIQDLNRAIAYEMGADPSGWDMNQVLRPVGTLNHKRGGIPVVIASGGDPTARYVPMDFSEIPVADYSIEKIPTLGNGTLPNASRLIGKYAFNNKEMDLLFKPEVQEGHRSTCLAALGHLLCEKGMDNAEIYSLITWADTRWGKFAGRDDAEKQYLGLLNYLRFKHPYKSALEVTEEEPLHLKFMGYRDLLEHTDVQKYFVEPKVLPDRGFLYIAGRAGVGKSNLTTELGFRFIFNQNYLDWTIPEQEERHTVMHIQLEMGTAEQKEVVLKMDEQFTEEQRDILQEHYKILCIQDAFKLYNPVHVAMFRQAVEHYKPTIVIIDSASVSFAPSLKDDEEKLRVSATNLFNLRQELNFATVVVGHAKKNTSKSDGMDAYFGMSVLEQYLSTGVLLTPDEDATDELRLLGDEDTQVIDFTYTKHRFGTDVGKSYPLHIKSKPLRFERPVHVIAPTPKVPVPKQNETKDDDVVSDFEKAFNRFGI